MCLQLQQDAPAAAASSSQWNSTSNSSRRRWRSQSSDHCSGGRQQRSSSSIEWHPRRQHHCVAFQFCSKRRQSAQWHARAATNHGEAGNEGLRVCTEGEIRFSPPATAVILQWASQLVLRITRMFPVPSVGVLLVRPLLCLVCVSVGRHNCMSLPCKAMCRRLLYTRLRVFLL